MTEHLLQLVGVVLAAVVGGIVSIIVVRTNAASSKTVAVLPPYEALAKRVATLEQSDEEKDRAITMLKGRLIEMSEDRDQLVEYVTEWFRWYRAGRTPPPPPVPMHLRDELVWDDDPDPTQEG